MARYASCKLRLLALFAIFCSASCLHRSSIRTNKLLTKSSGMHPKLHFTPSSGSINDPNGLVYHNGEYHLFFQSNDDQSSAAKSWGHAVSKNLFTWEQLPDALMPDGDGDVWSGSVVIDNKNTSGLQLSGHDSPMIAFYTNHSVKHPSEQTIAVSHDNGRTWFQSGQPVIPHFDGKSRRDARDPKVQWHEPSKQWIMVLFAEEGVVLLYISTDLHSWHASQEIKFDGAYECPDFFELPVEDESPQVTYWVLMMADGSYQIGNFDGKHFKAISSIQQAEYGVRYAGTTFNNEPHGRRVQMAWMRPDGPHVQMFEDVPFFSMLTTPMELRLVRDETDSDLLYIQRQPVQQLATLRQTPQALEFVRNTKVDVDSSHSQMGLKSRFSKGCGLDIVIQMILPPGAALTFAVQSGRPEDLSLSNSKSQRALEDRGVRVRLKGDREDSTRGKLVASADFEHQTSEMSFHVRQGEIVTMRLLVDWGALEIFDMVGPASMALYSSNLARLDADNNHCLPQFIELIEAEPNWKMQALGKPAPMPQVQQMDVYELRT